MNATCVNNLSFTKYVGGDLRSSFIYIFVLMKSNEN